MLMTDDITPANPYAAPNGNLNDTAPILVGELAGLGSRFGAAMLDGIIMSIVALLPLVLVMGGWAEYAAKATTGGLVWKIGLGVFGWAVYLLINGYFLAQSGQSIGKKMLGIKIVRTDGSQPPLSHIALRRLGPMYLAQIIPMIGPLLAMVDILLIFRSSRQCVHDQIADTKVVKA
jgi:uncharacterized RDD family membrane protein YckC